MNKIGDIITLEIFPEICCDECDSVIHNHISCPICKHSYASSDKYGELDRDDKEISCEECGTIYELVSSYWDEYNRKVKIVFIK